MSQKRFRLAPSNSLWHVLPIVAAGSLLVLWVGILMEDRIDDKHHAALLFCIAAEPTARQATLLYENSGSYSTYQLGPMPDGNYCFNATIKRGVYFNIGALVPDGTKLYIVSNQNQQTTVFTNNHASDLLVERMHQVSIPTPKEGQ